MKKTLRKIIAVGVSLVMFSASFTVRSWAECQDGTTVTGTAVTTDVTTPTTTDTTAATSVTTPTAPTTTNTTATEWRQPCVDGLFQPSDSVNPETSICGYSLNPLDYYSVAEWEQMAYEYIKSERSVNFVEGCKQAWGRGELFKLLTQSAGCEITYRNEAKTTYQAYRKNGKKFDAFLTVEDMCTKKEIKHAKKLYHYKSIKETLENYKPSIQNADYNKRLKIDKKKALKVGDYIQIESYLETQRVFTCFIPISAEKEKEIFDTLKKLYPLDKNANFWYPYHKVNNFNVYTIPKSEYQKGAPAYLVLNFDDTINSKDRPDWCRYAKMKYYIGQSYGFKDSVCKYDRIFTDNMNNCGYFHSFFYYFKVKKQLDSHGNLKAKVILKRPTLWRGGGSNGYWLDSSPSRNITMDCVDFMTKTSIDSCMPNFTTKMVGLTKEERKHLTKSSGGDAVVYWKNGIPEKYSKLARSTTRFVREKDWEITVKNPPFSD